MPEKLADVEQNDFLGYRAHLWTNPSVITINFSQKIFKKTILRLRL